MNVFHSTCNDPEKALATNSTASSFAFDGAPTRTLPTRAGFYEIARGDNGVVPSLIGVKPYAVASDNHTFSMRVWGWQRLQIGASATTPGNPWYYVPHLLIEVDLVVGNIAATDLAANTKFCDTITFVAGDETARIVSTENDTIAHFLVDLSGSRYVEFDFSLDSGSATSMNALRWLLS